MAFMRRQAESVPEADTVVWSCSDQNCTGWMRLGFSFDDEPDCPFCHAPMVKEIRRLPEIKS